MFGVTVFCLLLTILVSAIPPKCADTAAPNLIVKNVASIRCPMQQNGRNFEVSQTNENQTCEFRATQPAHFNNSNKYYKLNLIYSIRSYNTNNCEILINVEVTLQTGHQIIINLYQYPPNQSNNIFIGSSSFKYREITPKVYEIRPLLINSQDYNMDILQYLNTFLKILGIESCI